MNFYVSKIKHILFFMLLLSTIELFDDYLIDFFKLDSIRYAEVILSIVVSLFDFGMIFWMLKIIIKFADQDPLTGLFNRRGFMNQINNIIKKSKVDTSVFSVMYIDLDGFKQVNDTVGHEGGDSLLRLVSGYFKKCVSSNDLIARFGGDEFVILLANANEKGAAQIAMRIIELLNSPIVIMDHTYRITPSIGITQFPKDSLKAEILIKNADIAMYKVKKNGKNNFQFFEAEL